jgi:peptidoglycan/LPS O-acetylase OafA/YrhL
MATVVLPNVLPGRWAEFVFGMIAAELYATGRIAAWTKVAWPAVLLGIPASLLSTKLPVSHLLFGIVYSNLLCLVLASNTLVSRVFSWRPLVALGIMSYSIYLVHQPLVQGLAYVLRTYVHTTPDETFVGLVVLIPVIVAIAWVLFITVERRSLKVPPAEANRFPFALRFGSRQAATRSEPTTAPVSMLTWTQRVE